jgi:hypothetical protein
MHVNLLSVVSGVVLAYLARFDHGNDRVGRHP